MKIRLWFMKETEQARLYCKFDPARGSNMLASDMIWIPKSVVEHTSKRGIEHTVELPDWFIEKNGL